jgi:acyl dehydratase
MTETALPPAGSVTYTPGMVFPEWDCTLTAAEQARKFACCDIDPALYGDRADITHYALAGIMTAKRAGVSINGSVHMMQRFILAEPIMLGETLTIRGRVTDIQPNPRGRVVASEFAFVRPDGSVPLRTERGSLVLDAEAARAHTPNRKPKAAAEDPAAGMESVGHKQLMPEKVAAYSDEADNLIHSDPATARQFGFRAPIAAGLMAVRFMMEALARPTPPVRLDATIRFRRPMFWDEALDIRARYGVAGHIAALAILKEDGRVANDCVVADIAY